MMTLDEAIVHAEKVANAETENAEFFDLGDESSEMFKEKRNKCLACAAEHRQLAKWLEELKKYRDHRGISIEEFEEAMDVLQGWEETEKTKEPVSRWIPVGDRLPGDSGTYLVTVHDGRKKKNNVCTISKEIEKLGYDGSKSVLACKSMDAVTGAVWATGK